MEERNKEKERKRALSTSNTTEYFDKRIGLENDGIPMALAERVY
jgi:hypothetical protein